MKNKHFSRIIFMYGVLFSFISLSLLVVSIILHFHINMKSSIVLKVVSILITALNFIILPNIHSKAIRIIFGISSALFFSSYCNPYFSWVWFAFLCIMGICFIISPWKNRKEAFKRIIAYIIISYTILVSNLCVSYILTGDFSQKYYEEVEYGPGDRYGILKMQFYSSNEEKEELRFYVFSGKMISLGYHNYYSSDTKLLARIREENNINISWIDESRVCIDGVEYNLDRH